MAKATAMAKAKAMTTATPIAAWRNARYGTYRAAPALRNVCYGYATVVGMPKIVDHDQRRRELLEATAAVIAAEGIQAATVRRIAQQAGCTTGLVTHYFAEKDDLIIGALRHVHAAAADRMKMVVHGHQAGGMGALRAVLLEALPLTSVGQLEWRVWLSFWGVAWSSAPLSAEHRERYAPWRRLIHNLLRQAARLGQVTPDLNLPEATDRLLALIDGLGLQATYEPRRLTNRRVAAIIDAQLAEFTGAVTG